ncbi:MAG: hypothetical protein Tsb009_00930 [Planctomycetaceae bacterium]
MPLKIRCRECEKVLNVPDKARGKAIRCPSCQTTLKIPAGNSTQKSARSRSVDEAPPPNRRRRPAKAAVASEMDDFLSGVDLRRAEDHRVRVCVKCGYEVPEPDEDEDELIDCPQCKHNIDTGIMSERMQKKLARRGPDPEEYWGMMWKGSFAFVKENARLAIRVGTYWTIFCTLAVFSFFCYAMTENLPPMVFWLSMIFLFVSGASGLYWYISVQVIRHTTGPKRKKKMEKVNFDIFQNISLGLKSVLWPLVMAFPIVVVLLGIHFGPLLFGDDIYDDYMITIIVGAIIYVFAALMFPIAMVHMSMPYTYKGWLPVNLVIIFSRVALPALYWFLAFLAAILPIAVTLVILQLTWSDGLIGFIYDVRIATFDLLDWIIETVGIRVPKPGSALNTRAWWMIIILYALSLLPIVIAVAPFCIMFSFTSLFLMRANAYLALYFNKELDLVKEQTKDEPCGFGPRYLAWLVDQLVLSIVLGILFGVAYGLGIGAVNMGMDYFQKLFLGLWGVACVVIPWLYYARAQSSNSVRASVGQHSLGIVVTKENGDTLNFGEATIRHFLARYVSQLLLGFGCIMIAFDPEKKALHDKMLDTKVVWQGDDERKLYE